MLPNYILYYF